MPLIFKWLASDKRVPSNYVPIEVGEDCSAAKLFRGGSEPGTDFVAVPTPTSVSVCDSTFVWRPSSIVPNARDVNVNSDGFCARTGMNDPF